MAIQCGINPKFFKKVIRDEKSGNTHTRNFVKFFSGKNELNIEIKTAKDKSVYRSQLRLVRKAVEETIGDYKFSKQYKEVLDKLETRFAERMELLDANNTASSVLDNLIKTEFSSQLPHRAKILLRKNFNIMKAKGIFNKPMAYAEEILIDEKGNKQYVPMIYYPLKEGETIKNINPSIIQHEFNHIIIDRILRTGDLPGIPEDMRQASIELKNYLSDIQDRIVVRNEFGEVIKVKGRKTSRPLPNRNLAGDTYTSEALEIAVNNFLSDLSEGKLQNTLKVLNRGFNSDIDFVLNSIKNYKDLLISNETGMHESFRDITEHSTKMIKAINDVIFNIRNVKTKDTKTMQKIDTTIKNIYSMINEITDDLDSNLSIVKPDKSYDIDKLYDVALLKEFISYMEGFNTEDIGLSGAVDLGSELRKLLEERLGKGKTHLFIERINDVLSRYDKQYGGGLGFLSYLSQTGRYKLKKYFEDEIFPYFFKDKDKEVRNKFNVSLKALGDYDINELRELAKKNNIPFEGIEKYFQDTGKKKSTTTDSKFIVNQMKELNKIIPEYEDTLKVKQTKLEEYNEGIIAYTKKYIEQQEERTLKISQTVKELSDKIHSNIQELQNKGILPEQLVKEFIVEEGYAPYVLNIIEDIYGIKIDENIIARAKQIKATVPEANNIKKLAKEYLLSFKELNEFEAISHLKNEEYYTHAVGLLKKQDLLELATDIYGTIGGYKKLYTDLSPEFEFIVGFRSLLSDIMGMDRSTTNDNIFRYMVNNALLSMRGLSANALGGMRVLQTFLLDYPLYKFITGSDFENIKDNLIITKAIRNAMYNAFISAKTALPVNEIFQNIPDITKLSPEMSGFTVRYKLPKRLEFMKPFLEALGIGTKLNISTDEFFRTMLTYYVVGDTVLGSNITLTQINKPDIKHSIAKRLTEYIMADKKLDPKTITNAYTYRKSLDNILTLDMKYFDTIIDDMRTFIKDDEYENIVKSVILDKVLSNPNDHKDIFDRAINISLYSTGKTGMPRFLDNIVSTIQNDPIARYFAMFIRTSTNFTLEGIRHSPIGFALLPYKVWDAYKFRGTNLFSQKAEILAHQLSANLVGATIMGILYSYMKDGEDNTVITGSYNWNGDTDFKPYSIKLGDTWYSYQNIMPYNTALPLIVDAVSYLSNIHRFAGNDTNKIVGETLNSYMRYAISQTALRPLSDIVEYNNSIPSMIKSFSFPITSLLPRILYDITYSRNQKLNAIETKNLIKYIRSMTIRDTPPAKDEFGVEITTEITGDPAKDFILKMILPIRNYKIEASNPEIQEFAEFVKYHNINTKDISDMWIPTGIDRNIRFSENVSFPLSLEQVDSLHIFFNRLLGNMLKEYKKLYPDYDIEEVKRIYERAKTITYSEAKKNLLGITDGLDIEGEKVDIREQGNTIDEQLTMRIIKDQLKGKNIRPLPLPPAPKTGRELTFMKVASELGEILPEQFIEEGLPISINIPRPPTAKELMMNNLFEQYLVRYGEDLPDEMFEF